MILSSRSAASPIGQPSLQSLPHELLDELFVRLGAGEATVLACVSRALSSAYTRFKQRRLERLRYRFRPGAVVVVNIDLGGHDHWAPHGNRWAMRDGTVALVPFRRENVDHDSLVVVRLWDHCSSSTYTLRGTYLEDTLSVSEGGRMVSLQTFVPGTLFPNYNISSMVFEVGRSGLRLLSTNSFVVSELTGFPAPQFVGSQLLSLRRDGPERGLYARYSISLWNIPHTERDEGSTHCEIHRVARVPYIMKIRNDQTLALLLITMRVLRTTGGQSSTVDKALGQMFGPGYERDKHGTTSRRSPYLSALVAGSTLSLLLHSMLSGKWILAWKLSLTPFISRVESVWTAPVEHSIIRRAVLLSNESVIATEHREGEPVTFLRTRDGAILGRHDADSSSRVLPALPANKSSNLLVGRRHGQYTRGGLQLLDAYSGEVCGEVPVSCPKVPSAACDDRVVCFISAAKLNVVFL